MPPDTHGSPLTIDQAFAIAVAHHKAGRLGEAEPIYRQVLAAQPGHAPSLHLLGVLLGQTGRHAAAVESIGSAVLLDPGKALYHSNLGECCRLAGNLDQAMAACRRAIELDPNLSPAFNSLGSILRDLARLEEAADAYRAAIRLAPGHVAAYANLANVLQDQGRIDEAIALYQSALQINPSFADARCGLGSALRAQGRLDEAMAEYRTAIGLDPGHAEAWNNLGVALADRMELNEAIAAYRRAIAINGDYAEVRYNLSMSLLATGEYAQAWPQHEWRWMRKGYPRRPELPGLQWAGEPLAGRTILLYPEQGLGDTIQFVRFAPQVADCGGQVLLESPPELHRLLKNQEIAGIREVICAGQPRPPFDLHCALMSVPLCLGTTVDSIPVRTPYLVADPSLIETWRERLGQRDGRLQVGVAWAGNPLQSNDANRSMPPSHLAALVKVPGVRFHDLQKIKPAGPSWAVPAKLPMDDRTADLSDMADTAALIANLDLVISVDTSVAHLAGAMGKPVWVLLTFAPDWRYCPPESSNRWYPTMRGFRQASRGDWTGVIARVADALRTIGCNGRP